MRKTEREEKLAVRITTDYLKEEKNIEIKNARKLPPKEGEPPDYYFEIGDHKIGCEVVNFRLREEKKGSKLARELDVQHKIAKKVQRSLYEKDIPPLDWSMVFMKPPTEAPKHAEKIVNIITIMHNESITDSREYERNDYDKYYELFIENNISSIDIFYYPDRANIDEKYTFRTSGGGFCKTIEVEEMQAVITKKDKDIPNYKKIPNYKECYDQKWLIITDYGTIGYFILKGAAKEAQYKCNFDKVLYIQMSWIESKTRKQKRTGSLTDTFAVYQLKAESRASVNE